MTEVQKCLPRPTKSDVECLCQGHNRTARVSFETRSYRSQSRCSKALDHAADTR